MVNWETTISRLEADLKEAKKKHTSLVMETIPALFDEAEFSGFRMKDGREVVVEDIVSASIPKKNQPAAFQWCRDHDHGGIIKNEITIAFGKGEDDTAVQLLGKLAQEGYHGVKQKETIHTQTLKAWVRELIEQGDRGEIPEADKLPEELFGVFRGRKAVIK
jgi:hypothetical protein